MEKIDFLFKYLTSRWSLIIYLSIFAVTFSLAILLRFEFIEQNGVISQILKNGLADTSIYEIKFNQERKENLENLENFFLKIYTENNDCFNNTSELFNNTCKNGNSKYLVQNFCGDVSWLLFRDNCYKIFNDKTTWKNADATCSAQKASLFEARKAYSKNFLDSLVKALNIKEGIYFISYGKSESKYNWFWNFDIKNKKWSHEEECTELVVSSDKRYFGKYEDYSCNLSKRKFICQKKLQNYSQNIHDFIFENFNNLNLSKVLLQEIEKLTRDQSFIKTTNLKNLQKHIYIIIDSIIKFNQVDPELFTLKFNILNNILKAEPSIFKKEPNLSIKLLYVIEDLTKQISSNKLSPYKYLGSNFMITVNDYPLLNRNDSNNLNYLPISQEFYKNYEISGFSRVNIISKIKPKNAIKLKNKELMFPSEFNSLVNSLKTRISVIFFKNSKLFQSDKFLLSNPIINVMFFVISNMSSIFINNVIEYQTNLKKKELIDQKSIKCVSWNFNDAKGAWSDKNCHFLLNDPLRDIYKCSCSHTNIVGLAYDHITHVEKLRASKTLNNIGLMFSTFCLLSTLISNLTFRKINKSVQIKIHVILASTLLISNVLYFLISTISPKINLNCCLVFGALLHYFLISSFMFFLTNSIVQYSILINIEEKKIKNFYHKSKMFSFVLPAIIPLVVLCADHTLYINQKRSICWLNGIGLHIAFIVPTASIIFLNFGFLFSIIFAFFNLRTHLKISNISKKQITISFCCLILATQTWLLSLYLLVELGLELISEIVFCVFNTLLGLSIFISYVYLTQSKSNLWYKFFHSKERNRSLEQHSFIEKNLGLRPILRIWQNSISERLSDSHYYEEMMSITNYHPGILNHNLNMSLDKSSGYNSKPNSYSNKLFEDDVALRIDKLNRSLIRIKSLNQEISLKNEVDSLNIAELPSMFF